MGLPQRIEERLRTGGAPARSLAFNGWGTLLAAGCADGSITLFDYQTRGVAAHLRGGHPPAAAIGALLWSADGRTLLSGGADGCLAGWDVGAGERRLSLQLPGGPITRLAWVPPLHGQVGDPRQQQPAGPTGHLALLPGEGEVLVGRGTGPAVLLSLRDPSRQQELPLLAAGVWVGVWGVGGGCVGCGGWVCVWGGCVCGGVWGGGGGRAFDAAHGLPDRWLMLARVHAPRPAAAPACPHASA